MFEVTIALAVASELEFTVTAEPDTSMEKLLYPPAFAAPDGMMTPQRTRFESETRDEWTIYCYGDWENNEKPSIMLTTRTAPDSYLKYAINEYTRVPLYDLVCHDAVVPS